MAESMRRSSGCGMASRLCLNGDFGLITCHPSATRTTAMKLPQQQQQQRQRRCPRSATTTAATQTTPTTMIPACRHNRSSDADDDDDARLLQLPQMATIRPPGVGRGERGQLATSKDFLRTKTVDHSRFPPPSPAAQLHANLVSGLRPCPATLFALDSSCRRRKVPPPITKRSR
jgi:hypothetical protein